MKCTNCISQASVTRWAAAALRDMAALPQTRRPQKSVYPTAPAPLPRSQGKTLDRTFQLRWDWQGPEGAARAADCQRDDKLSVSDTRSPQEQVPARARDLPDTCDKWQDAHRESHMHAICTLQQSRRL